MGLVFILVECNFINEIIVCVLGWLGLENIKIYVLFFLVIGFIFFFVVGNKENNYRGKKILDLVFNRKYIFLNFLNFSVNIVILRF